MTDVQAKPRRKRRRRKKRKPEGRAEVVVRRGTAEDVPAVVALIVAERADREERGAHRKGLGSMDGEHMHSVMSSMAASGGLLVAELDGAVVGECAIMVGPAVFNPRHLMAVVFSLLVDSGARGRGAGTALLDMAEECARESGVSGLMIGSHWDGQSAARKFIARGHRLAESYYVKEIRCP